MGLGREVADAYIEIHGDLTDFRRDLEKVEGQMEALAKKNAKTFDKAMDGLKADDFKRKWSDMVSAMHSGEQLDFQRLIKSFDPHDLDEAEAKITAFMVNMSRRQKLTGDNFKATKKAILDNIDLMRDELAAQKALNDMTELHSEALKDNQRWMDRRAKTMEEAIRDNQTWARTFEGIRKNSAIKDLNKDFEKLAQIMDYTDVDKFMKGFSSFDEMRDRVNEVTDAMKIQGRISEENARKLLDDVNTFITMETELARMEAERAAADKAAKEAALQAAKDLREEQERYKKSLAGMLEADTFKKLETDLRSLTQAMATSDWSQISKGSYSVQEFRDKVIAVGFQLKAAGRISEEEFGKIIAGLDEASANLSEYNVKLEETKTVTRDTARHSRALSAAMDAVGNSAVGMGQKIGAMAGLNVLSDMIRSGGDFLRNIDRGMVSLSRSVTLVGALTGGITAAIGGMAVLGQDIANLGAIGLLAPAFLTGAGIGIGVLVASFKDMKTVLKDLGPQFNRLQDQISAKFWKQAEQPIRNLVNTVLPTLSTQLQNTATSMGNIFAELSNSITKYATDKTVPVMFERLNRALDRMKDGVEPAVRAFGTLGEVGSRFFERAADAMVGMIEDFDRWVQETAQNGEMERFIERAIQGFKDAGTAASAIVGIFDSIGDAARSAGIGGLGEFADAMVQTEETMRSSGFQDSMIRLFEGSKAAVDNMLTSVGKIGPDIQAAVPTISAALETIGAIVGKVVEHAGSIISNPVFLNGVTGFVKGVETAVGRLAPAMGPIGDSLGSLLSLMGRLLPPIADLISYVTVNLGPIFDSMLQAIEPLVKPTTDFVKEIVKLTTPALKTFAETTLPGIVNFASQLFTPLTNIAKVLTPAFATTLEDIGKGFHNAGEGLKFLNGQANEFKWPDFESGLPKPEDMQSTWGQAGDNSFWEDLGHVLFGGDLLGMGQRMMESWADDVSGFFPIFWDHVVDGFNKSIEAFASGWNDLWSGQSDLEITENLKKMFPDQAETIQGVQDFFDGIFDGIEDAWNGLLGWIGDLFGGGGGEEASGFGGAGSMSKGGKITPEMLGIGAPEENWLESTFNGVIEGITGFFTGIGEQIGMFGETVRTAWDDFWGGLGTKVSEVWTEITMWLSTKWTEITTGLAGWFEGLRAGWDGFWATLPEKINEIWTTITMWLQIKWLEITTGFVTWFAGLKAGWDTFWGTLPQKVNEVWTAITTWISTKVGEIVANITGFVTTVRAQWDGFWNQVNQKVQQIWGQIVSWIVGKVGEIRANISGFVSTVQAQWNGFWEQVRQKVNSVWGAMVSWIAGKVGEIRGQISGFVGSVRGQWDSFWQGVQQRVSSAWQDMVGAVSRGVENVMGFIRGLPGQISGALGGLGDLLTGAGSAIMDGLRRGIEAGFNAVKNVVGGIAGWIRDNKGPISYDRVLLIPAGEAIMQGLQRGIENEMAPLASTLHRVTESLVDTVTEGFAKSRMYIAGAEAALGLADGLRSNASTIASVFGQLVPELQSSVAVSGTGGVGTPTPAATTQVFYGEGAVQVVTQAQSPEVVASMVGDQLDELAGMSGGS